MNPRLAVASKGRYGLRYAAGHLRRAGEYGRLFNLFETKDFLAHQAGVLGGFRQGSRDLEEHVLPVAIGRRDWPRFLRHAVIAMGLRGLAEALADEEIVVALVGHGQTALAGDIVAQLTDSQARIRARAVVLKARLRTATDRLEEEGTNGIARLIKELDIEPSPDEPAAARTWLATLRIVARHLGPELQEHWSGWIDRLHGGASDLVWRNALADDAWLAVAESWLGRGDLGSDSSLWPALARVTSRRVLRFLPPRLAGSPRRAATFLDRPLPSPLEDRKELLLHVRVALLAAGAVENPWPRLRDLPIDSVECAELGHHLWPRLAPEQRDRLAATIDDATVLAAFRIVALEGLRAADKEAAPREVTAALKTLADLPPAVELHWSLRYLAMATPSDRRRQDVRTIAHHLYAIRYDVPNIDDLARFADLIAEVLPGDLPRVLPNLLAAPSSHVETLRTLAGRCRQEEILKELWENAERYAVAVAESDGEGFELRAEVLSRVTGRLCVLRPDLTRYRKALERLLPDEEDLLRLAVIDELAAGDETCRRLALEVCGELGSRRLALRRRLRLNTAGERLDDILSPADLYQAVSGSDTIADELAALRPLLALPATVDRRNDPGRRGLFLDLRNNDRRILAMLDLARHDLAFQRRHLRPSQLDPVAALRPLSRVVGGVTSDRRLVTLMPELVVMGSQVTPNQAVAELQESVLRLLRLVEVSWPLRAEALETILSHVGPWALSTDDAQASDRRKAAVTFFRWIVRLPAQPDLPDDLNDRWPELLPIVLAAAERLPASCRHRLHHPWPALIERGMYRLWGRWRSPWTRGASGFAAWAIGTPPAGPSAGGTPNMPAVCFAAVDQLAAHLGERLDSRDASPVPQALLCLLAARDADRVPPLLERMAPAARRALTLRLVRYGWLEDLPTSLPEGKDPTLRLAWELRRGAAERDAEAIVEGVAEAVGRNALDPLNAHSAPQRRALWTVETGRCCASLAEATISALAAGRGPAERALCFWVHGWVKPRPGAAAPEARKRRNALMAALRQAETIPGSKQGSS